jgi:hypothetical protein
MYPEKARHYFRKRLPRGFPTSKPSFATAIFSVVFVGEGKQVI